MDRFDLEGLRLDRLLAGAGRRVAEIPHALAWELSAMANRNRERIRSFEGRHTDLRCFVVANGPSLRRTDLSLLRDDFSIGLNRIYLIFENSSFRPTYYACVNELVLEQFAGEIRPLEVPKFLNWNRRTCFAEDPDAVFLKSKMVLNDAFQRDLTRPVVVGGTVTFVALQIAFYMGFRTVILVGLDHKYADKGPPSGAETRAADLDSSHFHPQYFPRGIKWQLPDLRRSEIDFGIARRVYEDDGREILDATPGGACQVFKKVDYASLF